MRYSGLVGRTRNEVQRHGAVALVFALFYVLLQSFSVAHATEYGDTHHTHNGHECILASIAHRDGNAFAPVCADLPAPEKAATPAILRRQAPLLSGHVIPASARAPPFFQ